MRQTNGTLLRTNFSRLSVYHFPCDRCPLDLDTNQKQTAWIFMACAGRDAYAHHSIFIDCRAPYWWPTHLRRYLFHWPVHDSFMSSFIHLCANPSPSAKIIIIILLMSCTLHNKRWSSPLQVHLISSYRHIDTQVWTHSSWRFAHLCQTGQPHTW